MYNYGVVLRRIRNDRGLSIKKASELINRAAGWISEVENSTGSAKLNEAEFVRIVGAYGAQFEPQKFSGWTTLETKMSKKHGLQFDGAILKYLRCKSKLSLKQAARKLVTSDRYLCDIENGRKPVSLPLRNRILAVYNYSPSSFKNFSSEDKRANNIPTIFKLRIAINHMREESLKEMLSFALDKIELKKGV